MKTSIRPRKNTAKLIQTITVLALLITVMASAAQGLVLSLGDQCAAAMLASGTSCPCSMQKQDGNGHAISELGDARFQTGCNCPHIEFNLDEAITTNEGGSIQRLAAGTGDTYLNVRWQAMAFQTGHQAFRPLVLGSEPILCHIRAVVLLT